MVDDISKLNSIHRLLIEAVCSPDMPSVGCTGVKRPLINAMLAVEELIKQYDAKKFLLNTTASVQEALYGV
jgi:hypothetical protein